MGQPSATFPPAPGAAPQEGTQGLSSPNAPPLQPSKLLQHPAVQGTFRGLHATGLPVVPRGTSYGLTCPPPTITSETWAKDDPECLSPAIFLQEESPLPLPLGPEAHRASGGPGGALDSGMHVEFTCLVAQESSRLCGFPFLISKDTRVYAAAFIVQTYIPADQSF